MDISLIKNQITQKAYGTVLSLRKHSPTILTGIAVAGVVATAVLAVKAAPKSKRIVEELKLEVSAVREETELDEQETNRAVTKAYLQHGYALAKVWAPTVTTGAVTITCVLGAHGIMRQRNAAIAAALKATEASFSEYRDRVVERLGEEEEFELRNFIEEEVVDEETGKPKKVKKASPTSPYDRVLDHRNPHWRPNRDYNEMTVRGIQNYVNDLLKIQGHVLLMDVYDKLGFDRTDESTRKGWSLNNPNGAGHIDFGLDRIIYKGDPREFLLDGDEIYISFNLDDGDIWDYVK